MESIKHFFGITLVSVFIFVMCEGFYYEMLEIDKPFYTTYKTYDAGFEVSRSKRAKDDEAEFRKLITGGFCVVGALYLMVIAFCALLPVSIKEYETWGMRIASMVCAVFFLIYMAPIFWTGVTLVWNVFF